MIDFAALYAIALLQFPLAQQPGVEVWAKIHCSVYSIEMGDGSRSIDLLQSAVEEAIPLYEAESEENGPGSIPHLEQYGYKFMSGYIIGLYFSDVQLNMSREILLDNPEVAQDGLRYLSLMQQMAEERYEEHNCDAFQHLERD